LREGGSEGVRRCDDGVLLLGVVAQGEILQGGGQAEEDDDGLSKEERRLPQLGVQLKRFMDEALLLGKVKTPRADVLDPCSPRPRPTAHKGAEPTQAEAALQDLEVRCRGTSSSIHTSHPCIHPCLVDTAAPDLPHTRLAFSLSVCVCLCLCLCLCVCLCVCV
jgi:hypothetical protein